MLGRAKHAPTELRSPRVLWRAHVIALVILLFPFFVVRYPLLTDYPNHLARIALLARYDVDPWVRQTFARTGIMVPNLAMDLSLPWVIPPLSAPAAGLVFIVVCAITFQFGAALVSRALLERRSYREVFLAALFMNSSLLYGFLNYMAALALFLVGFGLWLRWRSAWSVRRMGVLLLVCTAGFFAHLSFVAFFGLGAMVVTTWDAYHSRRFSKAGFLSAIPLLLLAILFLRFRPPAGGPSGWTLNTIAGKAVALLGVVRGYSLMLDLAVIVGCAVIVFTVCFRSTARDFTVLPALLAVVFAIAFIALPKDIFTANAADSRMLPPAFLFMILGLPSVAMASTKMRWVMLLALCIAVGRQAGIASTWINAQPNVQQSLAMLSQLPDGARVFVSVRRQSDPDLAKRDAWFEHLPNWETVRRDILTSTFFADPRQQPLRLRNGYSLGSQPKGGLNLVRSEQWQFVWAYGIDLSQKRFLRDIHAELLGTAGDVTLWRIGEEQVRPSLRETIR